MSPENIGAVSSEEWSGIPPSLLSDVLQQIVTNVKQMGFTSMAVTSGVQ